MLTRRVVISAVWIIADPLKSNAVHVSHLLSNARFHRHIAGSHDVAGYLLPADWVSKQFYNFAAVGRKIESNIPGKVAAFQRRNV